MTIQQRWTSSSRIACRLLGQVRGAFDRLGPVRADDLVVAAVSGGPDSVALLSLLAKIAPTVGFRLHVAHFDHGLRGAESAADARYVERLVEQWKIPLSLGRAAPGEIFSKGRGLQAAAREARYAFFERVAVEVGARWVVTAHTADDQAETVLMRLVRGAGPSALGGIPETRSRLVRPLLGVSRAEIEAYLVEEGITPRRDASNDNARFARTAVRRSILPVLRTLNPRVVESIRRTSTLLADDAQWLDGCAEERLSVLVCGTGSGWIELARLGLADLHPALRRRVLRRAVLRAENSADLSFEAVERLSTRVASRAGGRVVLGHDVAADLSGDRVRIERSIAVPCVPPVTAMLPYVGATSLPQWGLVATVRVGSPASDELRGAEARFDGDRVPGMLAVRSRRPGDVLYPEGMAGRKRLQDFFVDERVPRWRRDRVPLLVAGAEILWVIGMRRDRRYLANASSQSVVSITVQFIASACEKGGAT